MAGVVITGIGVITPIGIGAQRFWEALLGGRSGIGPVQSFDTSAFPAHIGAEVRDFRPQDYLRRLDPDATGRASQFAAAAALMALDDAGIAVEHVDARRTGVAMGTTSGEPLFVEEYNNIRKAHGTDCVPAEIMARYPCHVIPTHVAIEVGARGPCLMIPTAPPPAITRSDTAST